MRTRRAVKFPPSAGPYSDFHAAMSPRLQRLLALSILATRLIGELEGLPDSAV